jgi:hypothetical protein
MEKLFGFVLFLTCAVPAVGQIPIAHQRCHEQACAYSSTVPNRDGDTLIEVIRAIQVGALPCESTAQQCGGGLFLVSDLVGNQWQRAYSSWTSEVWFALNVKPENDIVGTMISHGYDGGGENSSGGVFDYDILIYEFPPSLGMDDSAHNVFNTPGLAGNNAPNTGTVTATTSSTLLFAWTDNFAYNFAQGPLTITPTTPGFQVIDDDGFLAVATNVVDAPGSYQFSAIYNGNAIWSAGLVAFKMGTPESDTPMLREPDKSHKTKPAIFSPGVSNACGATGQERNFGGRSLSLIAETNYDIEDASSNAETPPLGAGAMLIGRFQGCCGV